MKLYTNLEGVVVDLEGAPPPMQVPFSFAEWFRVMGFPARPGGTKACAELLGVSRRTVQLWRAGSRKLSRHRVAQLVRLQQEELRRLAEEKRNVAGT